MNKEYIGDSVYVEQDDAWPGMLILSTENGFGATAKIYLEPPVWRALTDYHRRYIQPPPQEEASENSG